MNGRIAMLKLKNENIADEIEERYIKYLEDLGVQENIVGDISIRELVKSTGLGFFTKYLKIIEIRPLEDYRLWCRLITGETKIYDFTPHLEQPMFQHLKNVSKFNSVNFGEFGVPTWISEKTGCDVDISISWILIDGVDVSENK